MIQIKIVSLRELLTHDAGLTIITAHHDEVESHGFALEPDLDFYWEMENLGNLMITGLFDGSRLAGYSVEIVAKNPHYKGKLFSSNDLLYIHEDYRHLGFMEKIISFVSSELKKRGVAYHQVTLKNKQKCSKLMESLGFTLEEVNWHRVLEK